MKAWCPQGTMYSHMDALLACGEALTRGATVNGIHECRDCGAWHVGQRKRIYVTCQAARKKMFSRREALIIVERAMEKFAAGDHRRTEVAAYKCIIKKGCGKWHVTSMEQEGIDEFLRR